MATVKGDVHDIGKNIVGVVLQCNNYEVIDLGVMVPAQKILDTARERNADIIGLSGLITPSLDEMCHVAAEMEREGFDLPLLDRRRHHEPRAHRGEDQPQLPPQPGYLRHRCEPRRRRGVEPDVAGGAPEGDCARARGIHAHGANRMREGGRRNPRTSIADARANRLKLDWKTYQPPKPSFLGTRAFRNYDLAELARYIDWTPFFQAWELKGAFPASCKTTNMARRRVRSSTTRRRC